MATKTYGTVSPERQKAMSGLEFVKGLASGVLPLNTIAQTLGYDVVEAESGRVVITLDPTGAHLNPWGTVYGGLTATLLDSCMGLAIQSTLEKGVGSRLSSRFRSSEPSARDGPDQSRGQSPQLRPSCRHGRRPRHRSQGPIARSCHDDVPDFSKLRCRRPTEAFTRPTIASKARPQRATSGARSTVSPLYASGRLSSSSRVWVSHEPHALGCRRDPLLRRGPAPAAVPAG
jgi:hypothetical protein